MLAVTHAPHKDDIKCIESSTDTLVFREELQEFLSGFASFQGVLTHETPLFFYGGERSLQEEASTLRENQRSIVQETQRQTERSPEPCAQPAQKRSGALTAICGTEGTLLPLAADTITARLPRDAGAGVAVLVWAVLRARQSILAAPKITAAVAACLFRAAGAAVCGTGSADLAARADTISTDALSPLLLREPHTVSSQEQERCKEDAPYDVYMKLQA